MSSIQYGPLSNKNTRRSKKTSKKGTRKKFTEHLNDQKYESELWFLEIVNKHQLMGFFRNPFIRALKCYPDFLWKQLRTVIEIDGGYHKDPEQKAKDKLKDEKYRAAGYRVFRIEFMDEARANEVCLILAEKCPKRKVNT